MPTKIPLFLSLCRILGVLAGVGLLILEAAKRWPLLWDLLWVWPVLPGDCTLWCDPLDDFCDEAPGDCNLCEAENLCNTESGVCVEHATFSTWKKRNVEVTNFSKLLPFLQWPELIFNTVLKNSWYLFVRSVREGWRCRFSAALMAKYVVITRTGETGGFYNLWSSFIWW